MRGIPVRTRLMVSVLAAIAALVAVNAFSVRLPFGSGVRPASAATVDFFLKLDGIDGESTNARHLNEIDIQSWSYGFTNTVAGSPGGGGGAGKAVCQDFQVKKVLDKSSPLIMKAAVNGQHILTAKLTGERSSSGNQFLTVELQDILVSSYQLSSSGDLPQDTFSLNFAKISVSYYVQKPDGTLEAPITTNWDCAANKTF